MSLKEKKNSEMTKSRDRICMILKKKLTPVFILTLSWGYIHIYDHIVEKIYWYVSLISGERLLQDRWSSGYGMYCAYFLSNNLTLKRITKSADKKMFGDLN